MTQAARRLAPKGKLAGLRVHLVAIVVATLLPALVVGTFAVWVAVDGYRAAFEDGLDDTAHALALAIDAEIGTFRSSMETLAGSAALDGPNPDLATFEREARRAATALGSSVALMDATSLQQVLNTALAPGQQTNLPANEVFRKVRETGRPLVTDILMGVVAGRPVMGVAVPVERDGRIDYVLSARLEPSRLGGLLDAQARDSSFATLIDGNNIVVARSRDHERFVGQTLLAWIVEGTAGRESGPLRGKNRLAEEFIGAFRRLSGAPGWFVTVGEPISDYYRAMWRPLAALTIGGLVTIGLALLVAFGIGRRIMRPVRALTRQAEAVIASGGTAAVEPSPPARVAEFERLRQAVNMAEGTLRTRATEVALVEARLRMAQEAAGVGVFEADLIAGRTQWSAEMFRLYGMDPAADAPEMRSGHLALVHPADRDGLRVARAARIADPTAANFTFEFRIIRADTGEVRWIISRGEFVRGPDGIAVAARGAQQDTTERKATEARQEFLMREVNHRAKNALAVVQSVVRLTRAEEPAAYAQAVEGRISALARAHTLLAEQGWASTELKALVDVELAPYGSNSVSCVGPAVPIAHTAAQPIGMVLHELATNAAKYGAFHRPEGKVKLRWWLEGERLSLRWEETGGQPIAGPPTRRGFGSRLIEATVRSQLGGSIEKCWASGGLICTIVVPLERAVATEGLPGAVESLSRDKEANGAPRSAHTASLERSAH